MSKENSPPKRRGCPPGGWPSQKAKKANAPLAVVPEVPWALQKPTPAEQWDAASKPVENKPQRYAFMVEQEKHGENLFRCVMLTLVGNLVVKRDYMSGADFKRNTMHKVLYCLTQIHCNDRIPESLDILPQQAHG